MIWHVKYLTATRMRPFRRWAVVRYSWRLERGVKRIRHDEVSAHFTKRGAAKQAARKNRSRT
jgi:hypothetical protein